MSSERVIAIDLGASSGRVIGVDFRDGEARIDSLHRFPNAPVRREVGGSPRWCWDLDAIMQGVTEGLAVVARSGPVDSIGIDSWAVDYGLVDEHGRLVAPVTAYRDERHHAAYERLRRELGEEAIYAATGIQFLPFNSIYQLATDALDPARPLDRASRMLMIPDLVAHRLCGSMTGERTNAGSTQCFDPRTDDWVDSILESAGVPRSIMPPVVEGGRAAPLGTLDPEIASKVGLPADLPILATATHDTAAAVAGAPLQGEGDVFISSGTWALVGLELPLPIRDERARAINATNEPGVFGTTRFLRNVAGLWLLQECRRAWAEDGRDLDWTELEGMAEQASPFACVFDPDDPSLAAPGGMPERIRDVMERAGEPVAVDEGAMVRAILDSVALKTAMSIEELAGVAGRAPERVVVVGGGAANGLLNRLVADCTGLPVVTGSTESTALGNAAVQVATLRGLGDRRAMGGLLPGADPVAEPRDAPGHRDRMEGARDRLRQHGGGMS